MKHAFAIALAALLTGCATQISKPAPQSYRLAGSDDLLNITGEATHKPGLIGHETNVSILFDGVPMIAGKLGHDFNGELSGNAYQGKPTAASCNSRYVAGGRAVEVRCAVFVGNERVANLTF